MIFIKAIHIIQGEKKDIDYYLSYIIHSSQVLKRCFLIIYLVARPVEVTR